MTHQASDLKIVVMAMALVVIFVVGVFIIAPELQAFDTRRPALPRCAEDVVLVGVGEFEGGQWTAYECGPAVDDFAGN